MDRDVQRDAWSVYGLLALELAGRHHAGALERRRLWQTLDEINQFPLALKMSEPVIRPTVRLEGLPGGVESNRRAGEPDQMRYLDRLRVPCRDETARGQQVCPRGLLVSVVQAQDGPHAECLKESFQACQVGKQQAVARTRIQVEADRAGQRGSAGGIQLRAAFIQRFAQQWPEIIAGVARKFVLFPDHDRRVGSYRRHEIGLALQERQATGGFGAPGVPAHEVGIGQGSGARTQLLGSGEVEFCEVGLEPLVAQSTPGFLQGLFLATVRAEQEKSA